MKVEELKSENLKKFYESLRNGSGTIDCDATDSLNMADNETELISLLLTALNELKGEVDGAVELVIAGAKEICVKINTLPHARVESIRIRQEIDDQPDLSYLETTASSHYGKDGANWIHVGEVDKKNIMEEYGSIWDACIAYALRDKERLAAYNRGEWHMLGISAKATVLIPVDTTPGPSWKIQNISSCGLWGVESDSGKEYLKQVADEQVAELRRYLRILNVEGADTCPVTEE